MVSVVEIKFEPQLLVLFFLSPGSVYTLVNDCVNVQAFSSSFLLNMHL